MSTKVKIMLRIRFEALLPLALVLLGRPLVLFDILSATVFSLILKLFYHRLLYSPKFVIMNIRPHSIMVSTTGFHPVNVGSIPAEVTI